MDPAARREVQRALFDRAAGWYSWERITDAYAELLGDPARPVQTGERVPLRRMAQ